MKKIPFLLLICLLICSFSEAKSDTISQPVVISGKVLNFDPGNLVLNLAVNQIGFNQKMIYAKLDSVGCFSVSFESFIPTDVWISYKMNFLVLIHPGDSLYVEFDGSKEERPDILKTIRFSGDASKSNQAAAVFQLAYYSSELYWDWDKKERTRKEYDLPSFTLYLDTLSQKSNDLIDKFVYENAPPEETRIWAQVFIDEDYYDQLCLYPYAHPMTDEKKGYSIDRSAYDEYFELLKRRLPLTKDMLISGYALSGYINKYNYEYLTLKTTRDYYKEMFNKAQTSSTDFHGNLPPITDSILAKGMIDKAEDSLAGQLVLAEHLCWLLNSYKIDDFEKNRKLIDEYLHEPFLKIPLMECYSQTKERIEHPKIASDIIYKKLEASGAGQIMNSILSENKDKVIYIDCWATWCGPCKSEMPYSKQMMKDMAGKDVAFVFLCLDSEEKNWKACLDEFQIGGQHIFLTKEQSVAIRESLEVVGVPYHILIDRSGNIIEKGNHLRPDTAKPQIERLLID